MRLQRLMLIVLGGFAWLLLLALVLKWASHAFSLRQSRTSSFKPCLPSFPADDLEKHSPAAADLLHATSATFRNAFTSDRSSFPSMPHRIS
jgi:hypothetical protein